MSKNSSLTATAKSGSVDLVADAIKDLFAVLESEYPSKGQQVGQVETIIGSVVSHLDVCTLPSDSKILRMSGKEMQRAVDSLASGDVPRIDYELLSRVMCRRGAELALGAGYSLVRMGVEGSKSIPFYGLARNDGEAKREDISKESFRRDWSAAVNDALATDPRGSDDS